METIDIIIYAAIAAFLASRLWSVLGQREEDQPPPRRNPFAPKDEEDQKGVPPSEPVEIRPRSVELSALSAAGPAPASLAGALDDLKRLDPEFNERRFLEGAKTAFTQIVAAYASGDLSGVRRYLGPAVLDPFERAISQRKEKGQRLENTIQKIVATDIIGVEKTGTQARLSVEFISHQTNQLKDTKGLPVEAGPARAEEVRDIWVFARDLRSANPNWQLVETRA